MGSNSSTRITWKQVGLATRLHRDDLETCDNKSAPEKGLVFPESKPSYMAGDPGGVATILPQVAQLVQSITGKATICGFGAEITANKQYSWASALAQNFSQGDAMRPVCISTQVRYSIPLHLPAHHQKK